MLDGESVLKYAVHLYLLHLCRVYVPLVSQVDLPFPASYGGQCSNILHCNYSRTFPRGAS